MHMGPPPMGGPRGMRHGPLTEEEKNARPRMSGALLRRIFSYLAPYRFKLAIVVVTILVSAVLGLLPSILTGKIIDEGLIGQDLGLLIYYIVLSLIVALVSNGIGLLEGYLNVWIAQHITYDMRNQMYQHLQTLPQKFFTNQRQGDILTRMTSDISGVQTVIANSMTNVLRNVAVLATSVVALFSTNWILALVGIALLPLFILPTKLVGKLRWKIARQTQEKYDEQNQMLNETLSVSGQMLVKLFGREQYECDRFDEVNRETTRLTIRENMAGRWFRMGIDIFISIAPMLLYLVGGILMLRYGNTDLTVGGIGVMVSLLSRMFMPVDSLLNLSVDFTRSMALFIRIFEYYDLPAEIVSKPDAIVPQNVRGDLEFHDVQFSYDGGRPVLAGVSFRVDSGKMVAVVGESGAGKSTLIHLIPRFYDVTGGSITLDGVDLRDLDLAALRRQIGMVTQDTYLFNSTIRENLLYAKPDATQEELEEACRKANIADFIHALPDGYETMVGNRGLRLSGGEKQRISIARVILKDPKILVLDEATSSLDSIAESHIQDAIEPLLHNRTAIVIAHRLSTILSADEILVLQDGKIHERGTHAELLGTSEKYRELYETQFARALEEERARAAEQAAAPGGAPGRPAPGAMGAPS